MSRMLNVEVKTIYIDIRYIYNFQVVIIHINNIYFERKTIYIYIHTHTHVRTYTKRKKEKCRNKICRLLRRIIYVVKLYYV